MAGNTSAQFPVLGSQYNTRTAIPPEIAEQKYISLVTFRKSGAGGATPVWFGGENGKLYIMTRSDLGKCERIRNNPAVKVASCTMSGKVTGPEFSARGRILPAADWPQARRTIRRKYWAARIPLVWGRQDAFLEIEFGA